ncbi:MAG: hypothetical protein ACQEP1_05665 [Nanobdellota archaeon]
MYTDKHIIYGLLFSVAIYPIIGPWSLIVFLSSVAIDFDHYILFVLKENSLDPVKAIRHFIRKGFTRKIYVFHFMEIFSLLVLLSFFMEPLRYIVLGMGFHIIMDLIETIKKDETFSKYSLLFNLKE